jgi:iron(III) transport system substrate-binding protein
MSRETLPRARRPRPARRRVVIAALAALGLVVLTACEGGAAAPAADVVAPPQSAAELTGDAQKEGQVDWYTVFTEANTMPIIAAFQKEYPRIKVTTLRLSAGQLSSRILTEQQGGQFSADVVSGNATYLSQLQGAGALQAYDPPDVPPLPAGLPLPDGYRGVVYINTTVIAYNPTALKAKGMAPPTSWEDLTKPEWKGQFSVDPESVDWYDSLIASMGHDKALALVKALGDNSPRITPNHTQQLTEMQAGETLVSATAYGPAAADFVGKDATRTAFVNPNPLPAVLTLSSLAKNAPHPSAAKLFQGWLLGKEGQSTIVTGAGKISIRSDVANDPTLWAPPTWAPAWADPTQSSDDYNKMLAEFTDAMHAG